MGLALEHDNSEHDNSEHDNSEHGNPEVDVPWWRRAVVYQIYPRSFCDGNGDGTGDLAGVRSKLAYLRDLGVDAVWFNPWYPSPLADGGYDVADYRDIHPRFGSLDEATALIAEANEFGIRVIVDIVPNHTSAEHRWFQAALAAPSGSAERSRYHFVAGKGVDGSEPPNNWESMFGGPAWTRVADGDWYLHLFAPQQPDLNWTHPEVLAEFDSIFEFWIDRGVDGFRIDVAHSLTKDPDWSDAPEPDPDVPMPIANHPHFDRDDVHDIIRRWRALLDREGERTGRSLMMVAETWVRPERQPLYLRPDEYHQAFNFDFLATHWLPAAVQATIARTVPAAASVGSTPTWTLSNHDVMRHATRLGLPQGTFHNEWAVSGPFDALDPELGRRCAAAATLMLLALPGSTYLYQGEELGLPEVWDLPEDVLDDPIWEQSGHTQRGRDGCRVPIPWTLDGPSFGFSTGAGWLPQPESFGLLSAAAQTGVAGSMLELYRAAMAWRRELFVDDESLEWWPTDHSSVVAFQRGSGVVSLTNFGPEAIEVPAGELLLASDPTVATTGTLPANTTIWFRP